MKSIRIVLLTAGALVALVGGAETATWGLAPLSAQQDVKGPQLVASGPDLLDNAPSGAGSSNVIPAASNIVTTDLSDAPDAVTGEGDARADSDTPADAPSVPDSPAVSAVGLGGHDAMPSSESATGALPIHAAPVLDAASTIDRTAGTVVGGVSPD